MSPISPLVDDENCCEREQRARAARGDALGPGCEYHVVYDLGINERCAGKPTHHTLATHMHMHMYMYMT